MSAPFDRASRMRSMAFSTLACLSRRTGHLNQRNVDTRRGISGQIAWFRRPLRSMEDEACVGPHKPCGSASAKSHAGDTRASNLSTVRIRRVGLQRVFARRSTNFSGVSLQPPQLTSLILTMRFMKVIPWMTPAAVLSRSSRTPAARVVRDGHRYGRRQDVRGGGDCPRMLSTRACEWVSTSRSPVDVRATALESSDGWRLWDAAGRPGRFADVCPQTYERPVGPAPGGTSRRTRGR